MAGIYQSVFESSPTGILAVDGNGIIVLANRQLAGMFGYTCDQLIGRPVEDLMPLRFRERHQSLRAGFLANSANQEMGAGKEFTGLRSDGCEIPLEIGLCCFQDANGPAAVAVVVEISGRKQERERREFLARELNHRTQNLFTIIEVIATRTFLENQPMRDATATFLGRLNALSKTYAILSDSRFQEAQLANVIKEEFAGFSDHISIHGCDLAVSANAAQQFALIVHELATNSLKYGALSSPNGHVEIAAKIENQDGQRLFLFQWVEKDGPPVFKPEHQGFGTTVLLDASGCFCRHAALDYDPQGLRYDLDVPVEAIEAVPMAPG